MKWTILSTHTNIARKKQKEIRKQDQNMDNWFQN